MTCLQCAEGPGSSTAAVLSTKAPNDSHLLKNYDFVANSTSEHCCIIAFCVLNFNALDISINVSHSSVPNGITKNFMCKIGTELLAFESGSF